VLAAVLPHCHITAIAAEEEEEEEAAAAAAACDRL
jgi:hypothetical protein